MVDGKYYFIRIDASLPVYVAQQVIPKNAPILPYVEEKLVKFRYFYSPPLSNISPKLIASKIISKNAIITKNDVKIAPAVLKGDIVSVKIKSQNITITTTAKALKDGNIGEWIPIELNRKIINAKVSGKNQVEITNQGDQ